MATSAPEKQFVRAQAKWVRMSARKGRVVAEHIRGRSVPEARAVLAFTQRAAAREIEKVLSSAVANAEANNGLDGDHLLVHTVVVDEGPTLKRWKARARGRVARIKKRTCHITVTLAPARGYLSPRRRRRRQAEAEAPKPPRRQAGRSTTARRSRSGEAAAPSEAEDRSPSRARRGGRRPRRRRASGTEDPSRRPARRRDPRLEVELVHVGQGVQERPRARTSRSASTSTASSVTRACPTS